MKKGTARTKDLGFSARWTDTGLHLYITITIMYRISIVYLVQRFHRSIVYLMRTISQRISIIWDEF